MIGMPMMPMMIRPSAAGEIRAAAEAGARAGVRPPRPPARPLSLPGAILEKTEYEGGGSFLADHMGVVQVEGPIWYSPSAFACYAGGGSASSIIHALARLRDDTRARAVVLDINSPGGESTALADLADAVRRTKAVKPVYARMHQTFSLGYALACLCDQLSASPGTMLGSIGSIMWMLDESKALEADGLRFLAASTGERKLHHAPGQPLGEAEMAQMQRIVDRCGADFFDLVAEGRGIDAGTVRSWQGAEFFAEEALALKLIDTVETEAAFYGRVAAIAAALANNKPKAAAGALPAARTPAGVAARNTKGARMSGIQNTGGGPKAMTADELYDKISSEGGLDDDALSKIRSMIPEEEEAESAANEDTTAESSVRHSPVALVNGGGGGGGGAGGGKGTPASFAQLQEIVPAELDSRDTMIVSMLKDGATASGAQSRVQSEILRQFKSMSTTNERNGQTERETAPYSRGRPAVRGTNRGGGQPSGTAGQRWTAAVSAVMQERGVNRPRAVAMVVQANPDLHGEYVAEANAARDARAAG